MAPRQASGDVRLQQGIRWVLAIPLAMLGATLAYALVQRILIAIVVRLGLSFELWWVRYGLGFFSLGLASFLLVLIPVTLAPARKRRTAAVAATTVSLAATGGAVFGLLNGHGGLIVDALLMAGIAIAAAAAVHARESHTV